MIDRELEEAIQRLDQVMMETGFEANHPMLIDYAILKLELKTLHAENAAMRKGIEEVYIEYNLYMEGVNRGAFNSEEEAAEGRNRIYMGILRLAEIRKE